MVDGRVGRCKKTGKKEAFPSIRYCACEEEINHLKLHRKILGQKSLVVLFVSTGRSRSRQSSKVLLRLYHIKPI